MMRRTLALALVILVAAAVGMGLWQWMAHRRVDGRTGSEWLALALRSAETVSYHAEGRTTVNGTQARFMMDQGTGGQYTMQVVDANGRRCDLGSDGQQAWYQAGATTETAPSCCQQTPPSPRGRVTGTATVAGRPAVLLATRSGPLKKLLAVDRRTGVVLSMRTLFRGKPVSEMAIDTITYRAVTPDASAPEAASILRSATREELARLLKRPVLEPRWLPKGFALEGTYGDRCPCCGTDLAVLRYTDGVATLTLFEIRGTMMCAMDEGCHMSPTRGALFAARRLGDFTIAAVGHLSTRDLRKVLDSLR